MNTSIAHKTSIQDKDNLIILIDNGQQLKNFFSLSKEEMDFAQKSLETAQKVFPQISTIDGSLCKC